MLSATSFDLDVPSSLGWDEGYLYLCALGSLPG